MERDTILEQVERGVALLTLNRPKQRNAFNHQMWSELAGALADVRANDAVRAVVVTGAKGAFTAGQDLGEMSRRDDDADRAHGFADCMNEICAFDKPLLAAVNGVGVGFGFTFLLHCDIVHVAEGARLRAPFVQLGVVPEAASSYLLPHEIGWQSAAEIFFTADWIDAARCVELGIASRILEPDALLPETLSLAQRIARHPLGSLRHTKQLMRAHRQPAVESARRGEDVAFVERIGSPENIEAIQAFFEKRPPHFS